MKKGIISIIGFLLLLVFSMAGTALAADTTTQSVQSNGVVTPMYIPCSYYANGQHKYVYVASTMDGRSAGTHSAVVKNSDGSSKIVNCPITNWYTVKTFACGCGQTSGTSQFEYTSHYYTHN